MSTFSPEDLLPSNLSPAWERAVRIALSLFARYSLPAGVNAREWRADCEQEAWLALSTVRRVIVALTHLQQTPKATMCYGWQAKR